MNFEHYSVADWTRCLEMRHREQIQLGLERVRCVALQMGVLQWDIPIITVAGTNGKGSTVAALEAIYGAAGYRVGAYTSPHLMRFNERIKINQQEIDDSSLCRAFFRVEMARGETVLTYFEATTLAALYYFKQHALDVLILEVGMGGRLDACNIIDADVAVITTIDFDHEAYLGNTLDAIAYEKAGILRKNKPCIYADTGVPKPIIEVAKALNVPLMVLNQQDSYSIQEDELSWKLYTEENTLCLPKPTIHLHAAAAACRASLCLTSRLPLMKEHFTEAMERISILGRLELHDGEIRILYDVAHNPQSVLLLSRFIQKHKGSAKVHAVFSAFQDKDLCGLINPMLPCVDRWYLALLEGGRAASQGDLQNAFKKEHAGFVPTCFGTPKQAYLAAQNEALSRDIIVIYGSFLMVSAIRGLTLRSDDEISNG